MRSLRELIRMLRPKQWLKNLMLFFPPFLAGNMRDVVGLDALYAFTSFCLASSSLYILNDIRDRGTDQLHPLKKNRPLASGAIEVTHAAVAAPMLFAAALVLASKTLSSAFLVFLAGYAAVSFSYSIFFKRIPVADIFFISAGFILRLYAGGSVFGIPISGWLFITVFLLALFLSTGKRIGEKSGLGEDASSHRPSLQHYPAGFLEGVLYGTGAAVLVTYSMYSLSRNHLVYTVPLCCFGLFRYIYRIKSGACGDPTNSLISDGVLFAVGLLWVVSVALTIYW